MSSAAGVAATIPGSSIAVTRIQPAFAVSGRLDESDFAAIAVMGFRSIISNRPDGEDPSQLSAREEAVLAWRHGLRFAHVPAAKHDLFDDAVIESMGEALEELPGPILAHCASGMRSAIVWAAAAARSQGAECVLEVMAVAGLDLEVVRDELEQEPARRRWLGRKAQSLDCGC